VGKPSYQLYPQSLSVNLPAFSTAGAIKMITGRQGRGEAGIRGREAGDSFASPVGRIMLRPGSV